MVTKKGCACLSRSGLASPFFIYDTFVIFYNLFCLSRARARETHARARVLVDKKLNLHKRVIKFIYKETYNRPLPIETPHAS